MEKLKVKSQKSKLLVLWCSGALVLLFLNLAVYAQGNSPRRLISLGPSLTKQIFLLGVEDRLIANTIHCQRPPEAKKKEKIGTVMRANIEKIVSLRPDLVLATPLTHPEQKEKLRNLGIRVVGFPLARNFSQICEQFLELAGLVGAERKAAEIVDEAKKTVNSIRRKTEDLPPKRVFLQVGARPLWTVIRDSFINDFIEFAGGINIAAEAKTGLYSREKVLKSNPEVIIIMDMVGEEEKEVWQRFKTLSAVRNNRIYFICSYQIGSPTPTTFAETLEEIMKILHPHYSNSLGE